MYAVRGARGSIGDPKEFITRGRELAGPTFQAVSPACVLGREHASVAARHAHRRMERERSRCRDPALEIMLALAATHQISRAVEVCALRDGDTDAVLFFDDQVDAGWLLDALGMEHDDSVLDPAGKEHGYLDIPDVPDDEVTRWAVEAVNLAQLGQ